MFENIQRILFRKRRDRIYKEHILDYLFWECTLRCNLNCLHCGSDCLKISETPDMPVKDFIEVLDDIRINYRPANLFVCITGGEPLLHLLPYREHDFISLHFILNSSPVVSI